MSRANWRIASRNGKPFDIADGAADFGDDDVDVVGGELA